MRRDHDRGPSRPHPGSSRRRRPAPSRPGRWPVRPGAANPRGLGRSSAPPRPSGACRGRSRARVHPRPVRGRRVRAPRRLGRARSGAGRRTEAGSPGRTAPRRAGSAGEELAATTDLLPLVRQVESEDGASAIEAATATSRRSGGVRALPAPFGPRSTTASPRSIARFTRTTAGTSPNSRVTPSRSTAASRRPTSWRGRAARATPVLSPRPRANRPTSIGCSPGRGDGGGRAHVRELVGPRGRLRQPPRRGPVR